MLTVDPNYPVFVLAFCVFHKRHYCEKVVPSLQQFKLNYFGHDHVVVECREKRKITSWNWGFGASVTGPIGRANGSLEKAVIPA